MAKDVGNCKIHETLYLWAFGQEDTKSVENSRKHKIWEHEISVLLYTNVTACDRIRWFWGYPHITIHDVTPQYTATLQS